MLRQHEQILLEAAVVVAVVIVATQLLRYGFALFWGTTITVARIAAVLLLKSLLTTCAAEVGVRDSSAAMALVAANGAAFACGWSSWLVVLFTIATSQPSKTSALLSWLMSLGASAPTRTANTSAPARLIAIAPSQSTMSPPPPTCAEAPQAKPACARNVKNPVRTTGTSSTTESSLNSTQHDCKQQRQNCGRRLGSMFAELSKRVSSPLAAWGSSIRSIKGLAASDGAIAMFSSRQRCDAYWVVDRDGHHSVLLAQCDVLEQEYRFAWLHAITITTKTAATYETWHLSSDICLPSGWHWLHGSVDVVALEVVHREAIQHSGKQILSSVPVDVSLNAFGGLFCDTAVVGGIKSCIEFVETFFDHFGDRNAAVPEQETRLKDQFGEHVHAAASREVTTTARAATSVSASWANHARRLHGSSCDATFSVCGESFDWKGCITNALQWNRQSHAAWLTLYEFLRNGETFSVDLCDAEGATQRSDIDRATAGQFALKYSGEALPAAKPTGASPIIGNQYQRFVPNGSGYTFSNMSPEDAEWAAFKLSGEDTTFFHNDKVDSDGKLIPQKVKFKNPSLNIMRLGAKECAEDGFIAALSSFVTWIVASVDPCNKNKQNFDPWKCVVVPFAKAFCRRAMRLCRGTKNNCFRNGSLSGLGVVHGLLDLCTNPSQKVNAVIRSAIDIAGVFVVELQLAAGVCTALADWFRGVPNMFGQTTTLADVAVGGAVGAAYAGVGIAVVQCCAPVMPLFAAVTLSAVAIYFISTRGNTLIEIWRIRQHYNFPKPSDNGAPLADTAEALVAFVLDTRNDINSETAHAAWRNFAKYAAFYKWELQVSHEEEFNAAVFARQYGFDWDHRDRSKARRRELMLELHPDKNVGKNADDLAQARVDLQAVYEHFPLLCKVRGWGDPGVVPLDDDTAIAHFLICC